jgi:hypothetical protein
MTVSVLQPFELFYIKNRARVAQLWCSGYFSLSRHFACFFFKNRQFVVTGFIQNEKEKQSLDHKEL